MLQATTVTSPALMFTDSAIAKIRVLIDETGDPNLKLRVAVSGGGCSGFKYVFSFEEKATEEDFEMNHGNVTVLVDATSMQYLGGAEIGYEGEGPSANFVIKNVTAATSCGCGGSSAN